MVRNGVHLTTNKERNDLEPQKVPEVTDLTSYVGLASPMDFNGLVRHYYMRRGDNVAEVRINLVGKKSRKQQSHGIGLRLRDELTAIADRHKASLKIVETPPGPPVLSTLIAEVRGPTGEPYERLVDTAQSVRDALAKTPGVSDVDWTMEDPRERVDDVWRRWRLRCRIERGFSPAPRAWTCATHRGAPLARRVASHLGGMTA